MRLRSIVPFIGVLPFGPIAFAQNWLNTAGGSWGNTADWNGGALPDSPTFDLGSSGYTVTLDKSYILSGAVTVQTDTVTLGLNGFTLDSPSLNIATGAGQVGSFTLLGPGTYFAANVANMTTGEVSGGQLTVDGANLYEQGEFAGAAFGVNGLLVESAGSIQLNSPGNFSITNGTFNDGTLNTTHGTNLSLNQMMLTNGSNISSETIALGNAIVDDSNLIARTSISVTGALTVQDHAATGGAAENVSGTVNILPTAQFASGELTLTNSGTIIVQLNSQVDDATSRPFTGDNGTLDFTLQNGFVPAVGEQFNIFGNTAPIYDATGTFAAVNLPALPAGESWNTSDLYTTGQISVVPEPASSGMAAFGIAGLMLRRRRAGSS